MLGLLVEKVENHITSSMLLTFICKVNLMIFGLSVKEGMLILNISLF